MAQCLTGITVAESQPCGLRTGRGGSTPPEPTPALGATPPSPRLRRSWPRRNFSRADQLLLRSSEGLGELAADEGGAGAEGVELGAGEITTEGDHAAVGAGEDLRGLDVAHRLAEDRGHLLGRLHAIARHVDGPDQYVLVAEEPDEGHGHVRVGALQGDAADAALREQREG